MEDKCGLYLVSFDFTSEDVSTLMVGKLSLDNVEVIGTFRGEEAKRLYHELTKGTQSTD